MGMTKRRVHVSASFHLLLLIFVVNLSSFTPGLAYPAWKISAEFQENFIPLTDKSPDSLFQQGLVHYKNKAFEQALASFEKSIIASGGAKFRCKSQSAKCGIGMAGRIRLIWIPPTQRSHINFYCGETLLMHRLENI